MNELIILYDIKTQKIIMLVKYFDYLINFRYNGEAQKRLYFHSLFLNPKVYFWVLLLQNGLLQNEYMSYNARIYNIILVLLYVTLLLENKRINVLAKKYIFMQKIEKIFTLFLNYILFICKLILLLFDNFFKMVIMRKKEEPFCKLYYIIYIIFELIKMILGI